LQASCRRNHSFPNDFHFPLKLMRRICCGSLAEGQKANYSCASAQSPRSEPKHVLPNNRTQGMRVNDQNMADHLQVDRYSDFWLTDAIRPAKGLPVVPRQGYRIDTYRDEKANFQVPVLAAAVSRENLFEVFLELLDPLGEVVDVVLETSHDSTGNQHLDLFREAMDLSVFKSHCCDYEKLLLHDGCT